MEGGRDRVGSVFCFALGWAYQADGEDSPVAVGMRDEGKRLSVILPLGYERQDDNALGRGVDQWDSGSRFACPE